MKNNLILACLSLFISLQGELYSQTYYTCDNEGPYHLNEEWIGIDCNGGCDTIEGYWTDSIFNAGRIQYVFTDNGITKLTKLFFQGRVYKNCSILNDLLDSTEYSSVEYPYWSISREYLNGISHTYLLGHDEFDIKPIVKVYVTDVFYNMDNKTIRGQQNGKPFYLWNGVGNELTTSNK